MRKYLYMSAVAVLGLAATSCSSKLGALSADNFTVTPTPLEEVGGVVDATISATFPEKYMNKNASVVVTPVLKFNGQEVTSPSSTFQGEKVEGNGTTVNYKVGGNYTMKAQFNYTDEMQQSDLYLRFAATVGGKTVEIPEVKVGYGIVSTASLLQGTVFTASPATAADAFQKVIKQKQEAQIKYLVNQANVRASELKTTSIQDFVRILKEINDNEATRKLTNIEVSAYASPEGSYDFNEKLAQKRQKSGADYVNQQLKKNKMTADVETHYTAEDWEGFQQLVAESNIQDKDVILRVLSMYKDPVEREQQIRNMSVVYDELAKGILPELRRARLIANYEVIGRTDEQIVEQFASDARKLSLEELLYGANLQQDLQTKKAWYEKAAQLYPTDARAFNNLASIAYQTGDMTSAKNYIEKAKSLSGSAAEVATNEALLALANGNAAGAETLLARGTGSESYSEVMGNLNIAKGNYAAAAAALAGTKSNSAALAQILNKDYNSAASTLASIANPDGYTSYLKAVLAARTNDSNGVVSNLRTAIEKDSSLAARAAKDLEFAAYAAQIAGIVK